MGLSFQADVASRPSVDKQLRQNASQLRIVDAAVLLAGLCIAFIGYRRSYQPYLGVSLLALTLVLLVWMRYPRVALGVTVFLALIGDIVTVSWFPFNKNLSSTESVMYVADRLTMSPFEIVMVFALMMTAVRGYTATGRPFRSGPLMRPMMVLMIFVAFGFVTGISAGGDMRVAIFEVRPLLYIPILYLLVINVCRTRTDYQRMVWSALAAIVVQSCISLLYYFELPATERADLESLNEHGAAISMNLLFAVLIAATVYKGISGRVRIALLVASLPTWWVYFLSQRRAAIVALGGAMILFAVTLFWRQRRTFWKVIPVALVAITGYVGAFWTSDAALAFPAQAIKGVIAPTELGAADQSSDLYREIEKFNLSQTIRSAPLTGLGFGQPFLRPIPLPDISSFEFAPYLPHNSLLWLWIKTGFFGFATMMYIIARAVSLGSARIRMVSSGLDLVVASSAVFFVVMYSIYLYVEIGWEPRNVTLMALFMGLCTGPLREHDSVDSTASDSSSPLVTRDPQLAIPSP